MFTTNWPPPHTWRTKAENDEIQLALDACKAAWEAHPEAKYAWCCHHEMEAEPLTDTPTNRMRVIVTCKVLSEQIRYVKSSILYRRQGV